MGWIAALVAGVVIGVMAEKTMPNAFGTVRSAIAGAIGALLINALFLQLDAHLGDTFSFVLASVVGAPIAIGIARMARHEPFMTE